MANKRLDQLSNTSTIDNDDLLLVYDVDEPSKNKTKNITYSQFHTLISGTVGGGGGGISEVVEDSTPQLGGDLDVNSNAIIAADYGEGTGAGSNLNFWAGEGGTTGGNGGYFWSEGRRAIGGNGNGGSWSGYGGGGAGSGDGGKVELVAGNGGSGGGTGGDANLHSGLGTGGGDGGTVNVGAHNSVGGAAGNTNITAGDGTTAAGNISLIAGDSQPGAGIDGGDIILTPGEGDGAGNYGAINITQTTAPTVTTDKLYNVSGTLTWNGTDLTATTGVSGWFDDGENFRCTVTNGLITAMGATVSGGYNVA